MNLLKTLEGFLREAFALHSSFLQLNCSFLIQVLHTKPGWEEPTMIGLRVILTAVSCSVPCFLRAEGASLDLMIPSGASVEVQPGG